MLKALRVGVSVAVVGLLVIGCGVHATKAPTGHRSPVSGTAPSPGPAPTPPPKAVDRGAQGSHAYLAHLDMVTPTTGVAWGYENARFAVWRTADGGAVWTPLALPVQDLPKAGTPPPIVRFHSASTGWIAWITPGKKRHTLTVLRTTSGGSTWETDVQPVSQAMNMVKEIRFASTSVGWIRAFSGGAMNQGDTDIYRTDDGGQSWTLASAATGYIPNDQATPHALPAWDAPMPMAFTSPTDGWVAVGNFVVIADTAATLYHTTTSGRTWFARSLPVPTPYRHQYVTSAYPPVFSGTTGTVPFLFQGASQDLVAYHTVNGGRTWSAGKPLPLKKAGFHVSVSFAGPQDGWVIGEGDTFDATRNGGVSWAPVPFSGALRSALDGGWSVTQIDMVTPKTGWVLLTKSGQQTATKLMKTTDAGRTWETEAW